MNNKTALVSADTAAFPLGQTAFTSAEQIALKTVKFRFWLSLTALFMSAIFGILAIVSVAAGYGLANEVEGGDPLETIFTFKIVTAVFMAMTGVCVWTAYKLRPGGD